MPVPRRTTPEQKYDYWNQLVQWELENDHATGIRGADTFLPEQAPVGATTGLSPSVSNAINSFKQTKAQPSEVIPGDPGAVSPPDEPPNWKDALMRRSTSSIVGQTMGRGVLEISGFMEDVVAGFYQTTVAARTNDLLDLLKAREELQQLSPSRSKWGENQRKRRATFLDELIENRADSINSMMAELKKMPPSARLQELSDISEFADVREYLSEQGLSGGTRLVAELFGRSLIPSVKSGVAGAAGGLVGGLVGSAGGPVGAAAGTVAGAGVGAGIASANTEFNNSVLATLQEAGVDVTDLKQLEKAASNEELMAEATGKALVRGGVIGSFDGIAQMVPFLQPLRPAVSKGIVKSSITAMAQLNVQGALGGGGEAIAQLATEGKIMAGEVAAEFLGEFATGPVEISAAAMTGYQSTEERTLSGRQERARTAAKAVLDAEERQLASEQTEQKEQSDALDRERAAQEAAVNELDALSEAQTKAMHLFVYETVGINTEEMQKKELQALIDRIAYHGGVAGTRTEKGELLLPDKEMLAYRVHLAEEIGDDYAVGKLSDADVALAVEALEEAENPSGVSSSRLVLAAATNRKVEDIADMDEIAVAHELQKFRSPPSPVDLQEEMQRESTPEQQQQIQSLPFASAVSAQPSEVTEVGPKEGTETLASEGRQFTEKPNSMQKLRRIGGKGMDHVVVLEDLFSSVAVEIGVVRDEIVGGKTKYYLEEQQGITPSWVGNTAGKQFGSPMAMMRELNKKHREAVETAVPEAVETAVPEAVETAVPEAVETAVPEAVETAVPEAVETAVPEAVETAVPEAVETAVPEAVETAVPEAVETAVPEAVEAEPEETSAENLALITGQSSKNIKRGLSNIKKPKKVEAKTRKASGQKQKPVLKAGKSLREKAKEARQKHQEQLTVAENEAREELNTVKVSKKGYIPKDVLRILDNKVNEIENLAKTGKAILTGKNRIAKGRKEITAIYQERRNKLFLLEDDFPVRVMDQAFNKLDQEYENALNTLEKRSDVVLKKWDRLDETPRAKARQKKEAELKRRKAEKKYSKLESEPQPSRLTLEELQEENAARARWEAERAQIEKEERERQNWRESVFGENTGESIEDSFDEDSFGIKFQRTNNIVPKDKIKERPYVPRQQEELNLGTFLKELHKKMPEGPNKPDITIITKENPEVFGNLSTLYTTKEETAEKITRRIMEGSSRRRELAFVREVGEQEIFNTMISYIFSPGYVAFYEPLSNSVVFNAEVLSEQAFIKQRNILEIAARTYLHEVVAHGGLNNLFSKQERRKLLNDVWTRAGTEVRNGIQTNNMARRYGFNLRKATERRMATEEYIALIAESLDDPVNKPLLRRVIDRVKRLLVQNFNLNWSDGAVRSLLRNIRVHINRPEDKPPVTFANFQQSAIRYSRMSSEERTEELDGVVENLRHANNVFTRLDKATLGQKAMGSGETVADWARTASLYVRNRRNIRRVMSREINPEMHKLLDREDLAAESRYGLLSSHAELSKEWGGLPEDENLLLSEIMHVSTLARQDPTSSVALMPTAVATEEVKEHMEEKHRQLKRMYEELSPEGQRLYKKVRNAYKNIYLRRIEEIRKRIIEAEEKASKSGLSTPRLAEIDRTISRFEKQIKKGPFFPLMRHGKLWARAVEENGDMAAYSLFQSRGERDQWIKQAEAAGYETRHGKIIGNAFDRANAVSPDFVQEILNIKSLEKEERDQIYQLYLETLPDLSIRKHFIHRKGTAGYSGDARRNFNNFIFHADAQHARLVHGRKLNEILAQLEKRTRKLMDEGTAPDATKEQKETARWAPLVYEELLARHELSMNPDTNPLSTALTGLGFLWFLGYSPAAAVVNLSQLGVTATNLGARYGYSRTVATMGQVGKTVGTLVAKNEHTKRLSIEDGIHKTSEKLQRSGDADTARALRNAYEGGYLTQTFAAEVAKAGNPGMWDSVSPSTGKVMGGATAMFSAAESYNRVVTFLTAYKLARGKKKEGSVKDLESAKKAVYDTQFDYSQEGRSRLTQGNVKRVAFLFKQHPFNMAELLVNSFYDGFLKGNENPQERAVARKQFVGYLTWLQVTAGAIGIPVIGQVLSYAASTILGDEEELLRPKDELQKQLAKAVGPDAAYAVTYGVVDAFSPISVADRMSMLTLGFPQPYPLDQPDTKIYQMMGEIVGGPIFSMGARWLENFGSIVRGDKPPAKLFEAVAPKALADITAGFRFATQGEYSNHPVKREVMKPSLSAGAAKMIGFQPSELALIRRQNLAEQALDKRTQERGRRLINEWKKAVDQEDIIGQQKALERWANFVKANPAYAVAPGESLKGDLERRALSIHGVYIEPTRRFTRTKEARDIFPATR